MGVTSPPGLVAARLLVYDVHVLDSGNVHDQDVHTVMRFYADAMLPGARTVGFSGLAELVTVLQTYASIDVLTLFTHAFAGNIGIYELTPVPPGTNTSTTEPGATVFTSIDDFLALFNGKFPTAREIRFEGCNIASELDAMVKVKRAFNSDRVSGFNMYHALRHGSLWVHSPDVVTQVFYDGYVASLGLGGPVPPDYYLPGATDLSEMIGGSGVGLTAWEWFSPVYKTPLTSVPDRKLCFRRDDRRTLTYTEDEALDAFFFADQSALVELVVVD